MLAGQTAHVNPVEVVHAPQPSRRIPAYAARRRQRPNATSSGAAVRLASALSRDEDLIGTSEAARRLGVSSNRVRQLIETGQLPAKRVGRQYVILRRVIDRFQAAPPGKPHHPRRVSK
jgi:excisionase family DNA binding protein